MSSSSLIPGRASSAAALAGAGTGGLSAAQEDEEQKIERVPNRRSTPWPARARGL